jgi:tetratricopeptide (TPR) repeat protein
MNSSPLLKVLCSAAAVTLLTSGCGQSETAQSVPGASTVSAEQTDWKTLTTSADAAVQHGNAAEAEKLYRSAMDAAMKLGADDPGQAQAVANLANFYYVQGDGQQANILFKQSLALREKALGLEHADLARDLIGLARVSKLQRDYADAGKYYARAVAILKKSDKSVPPEVESEYTEVQQLASSQGKTGTAR